MKRPPLLLLAFVTTAGFAADASQPAPDTIDLPTALRLAGANNLDVQIAQEKVVEARAASDTVRAKFFPWVAPSITLRRHEENIQEVRGAIIDVERQSLSAGIAINAQVDIGETYYQNLVARQAVRTSEAAL
ncbi:MAG: hypothetical protein WD941_01435, partial [Opitutus sp.]